MHKDKHSAVPEKSENTENVENPPGILDMHPVVGLLFGLFFCVFSLAVCFQNLVSPDSQLPADAASWKTATGNVVRSTSHYRRGGDWYTVTFQYQVNGKSYQFDDKSDAKIEKTELKYDLNSPSHYYREQTIEERNNHMLAALFCFLVGGYQSFRSLSDWRVRLKSYNVFGTILFTTVLVIFTYACANNRTYPRLNLAPDQTQPCGIARIL